MKRDPEVDAWFAERPDHPQREMMMAVRDAILEADDRIEECIKWKTPTFAYKGNLVSLQPNAKKFVSLMFHTGANIPGEHPLLEGDAKFVRTMRVADAGDLEAKRDGLVAVVRAWCDGKDG